MKTLLKEKISSGGIVIGTFVKIPALPVVDMLAILGYDFVIIDMEHSTIETQHAEGMIATADAAGMGTIIRVPDNQDHIVIKTLDMGCDGVQAPMIESVEDAQKLVTASKYYPVGNRSISFATRSARYGSIPRPDHIQTSNENQLVIAQIESWTAVEQADAIAAVDGIDVLFVGPADLSQSLGIPGQSGDAKVVEGIRRVGQAASRHGKQLGTHVIRQEDVPMLIDCGVTYLAYGTDVGFFRNGAQQALEAVRTSLQK